MPTGTYQLADGVVEHFSCAPGPAGWRYVGSSTAGRVDLTLDGGGRQVRLSMSAGGRELRGGVAGPDTVWVRDGVERAAPAAGFAGASPAFLVAAVRLLRLQPGSRARLRLVAVIGAALATRVVEQGWELVSVTSHPAETGPLPVGSYRVADLQTGEVGQVHVAGDVVLAAPGVELTGLESAPNL